MANGAALLGRNMRLFLRDRSAVFFSLLSSLIVLGLYFLFIARAVGQGMDEAGFPYGESAKYFLIYVQMMAGVMVLNSMSLSVGTFTIIARDFENRRVDSFLLTPIKTWQLLTGYFASGLAVSFMINLLVWAVAIVIIGSLTGYWLTVPTIAAGVGILALASFVSASIMLLLTALVKSSAAVSIFSSVAATFLGFLCGIYMPYSSLGKGAEMVGSILPFTHMTILFKQAVLKDAFAQLSVPEALTTMIAEDAFSARNIGFLGIDAPLWLLLAGCAAFAVIALAAAWLLLRRRTAQQK